jgi:hypothetical protein
VRILITIAIVVCAMKTVVLKVEGSQSSNYDLALYDTHSLPFSLSFNTFVVECSQSCQNGYCGVQNVNQPQGSLCICDVDYYGNACQFCMLFPFISRIYI